MGLRPGFSICDGGEQLGTVRRILRTLRIDDRRFDAKRLMQAISHAKNAGADSGMFREAGGVLRNVAGEEIHEDLLPDDDYRVAAIETYARYEAALRAQNVVDFDDLLLLTVRLIATDEEVRGRLQARWRYLMIDEYQDTNGAQLELMRRIAGDRRNLCVVGDDDQSIYGWRGADVENILRFGEHFPGARRVILEMNYRSTGRILQVANAVIRQNPHRYDKTLRPAAEDGDAVRIVAMDDEEAEAEEVANAILRLEARQVPWSQIAVLYRSNVQSRAVELALRASHVPYRVVGGMDLFDRKEIKDTLAYLKVLVNRDDEQSLRRIINYPPRGIGETTIRRIDDWAREHHLPLVDGLDRVDEVPDLSTAGADAAAELVALLDKHRKLLKRRKASTVVKKLLEAVRLEEVLFTSSDQASTASRRIDNVREVVRQLERFEQRVKRKARRDAFEASVAEPEEADAEDEDDELELELEGADTASLDAFLADLALAGWEDGKTQDDREDRVILSTIHAAKGLEWPYVFLVGTEEELLPHRRTVEGDGSIDEERRLAYVAITRARRELTVSYAKARTRYGQVVARERSRFLENLPDEAVERHEGPPDRTRSAEESAAIEAHWREKIRAQLGIE